MERRGVGNAYDIMSLGKYRASFSHQVTLPRVPLNVLSWKRYSFRIRNTFLSLPTYHVELPYNILWFEPLYAYF